MTKIWIKTLAAIILIGLLIAFPKVMGVLNTNIFIGFAIMALFAVSLNLMLGYTGLLSFGHAMFFGLGAYTTALSLKHIDNLPISMALLLGVLGAVVCAVIVSPLLVRLSGTAFSMLTLAFGQLMYIVCLKFREVTGGADGLGGFPVPDLKIPFTGGIDMTDPVNFYYFAITVLGGCILLIWRFTKTPIGSVMISIRDNDNRVDYLGFHVPSVKSLVFIVSGGFAGAAGAIYALFQNMVSTDGVLGLFTSFNPIIMTIIGGVSSFTGPIIGAGLLTILEEFLLRYTDRIALFNGLVLILMIKFAPGGIMGIWDAVYRKCFKRRTLS